METLTYLFTGLCLILGACLAFAGVLCAIWHTCRRWIIGSHQFDLLWLAIGMRLHGKKCADHLLWKAMRERAQFSEGEAKIMRDFAWKVYREEWKKDSQK